MRHIAQSDSLAVVRDMAVYILEYRNKPLHESRSCLEDTLAVNRHLVLPDIKEHDVRLFLHLKKGVTLLKCFVITVQSINVSIVILRYHHVHKLAPLLASAGDKVLIVRRHKDERHQTDVLRQSLIFLLVALEVLLRATLHATIHVHRVAFFVLIIAVKDKETLVVRDDL